MVLHADTPAPEVPRPRDVVFQAEPLPDLRNRPQADNPLARLTTYLSDDTSRVLFIAETSEFLTLEYAKGDRLYVPVSSLHPISRCTGAEGDAVPLHQLGSDKW